MNSNHAVYSGLPPSAIALTIVEHWTHRPSPTIVVAPDTGAAERLLRDIRFFCSRARSNQGGGASTPQVQYYPPWDVLPFDALSPSIAVVTSRLHSLYQLHHGDPIVVTTASALMQRSISPDALKSLTISMRSGEEFPREELLSTLIAGGYTRTASVEEFGQIAVRGSVLDVFPPGSRNPIRLEFFGDTLESIRTFETDSQRSIETVVEFDVLPVREIVVGEELRRLEGAQGVAAALQRLRARAAELAVPASKLARIEEAIEEGFYWPGLEQLQPIVTPALGTLLDHIPQNQRRLVLLEQEAIAAELDAFDELLGERAERAEADARIFPKSVDAYESPEEILRQLQAQVSITFDTLLLISVADLPDEKPEAQKIDEKRRFYGNAGLQQQLQLARSSAQPLQPLADHIRKLLDRRMSVVIAAASEARQKRMQEIIEGYGITAYCSERSWSELVASRKEPCVTIGVGALSAGFIDTQNLFALISEREVFPERKEIAGPGKSKRARIKRFLGSLADLQEGDFVVHMDYGIGCYKGLRQKAVEGSIGDFLELEYAEGSKLFIPVDALGKIQKYSGATKIEPKLSKLGGTVWEKTKRKVQEQVAALAGQLISTMAQRETAEGYAFGSLSADDQAFADAFPYSETADQAKAIADVLGDMAVGKPMDRLVCGDVGYGKTEVAMRAAYKAVTAGKQVAVVVPTTVLARQHYESFLERFENTAVKIGSLTRFNSPQENKRVLAGIRSGAIDIVVGTHRVLQRDVSFKDIGLVVIDEEHRFGVAHKERLKRFRSSVDVLTLSATPIPRTLHMSLVGIRDLSLIETAPSNRQVIRTYLAEYEDSVVREAILRELGRSGQVFFIHNRVQSIELVAAELQELVPEARIGIGHGQLKERELEKVMNSFVSGEIDVLVSTTIVESGLDIPNANTIIIRKAEHFGLAELYQLRGRVGRSARRAYAYLLIDNLTSLSKDARKRLEVLQALDDLGVGFKLALQDMEIRGAGNLLGKDQSGHINAIGYELYSRILKDAVEQLQYQSMDDPPLQIDPEIKIGFPTHIPPSYLPDVGQRLLLYQRLIELESEDTLQEVLEEVFDRFGVPPREVTGLFEYMALRSFARRNLIEIVRRTDVGVSLRFHESQEIDHAALMQLVQSDADVKITPARSLLIRVTWEAIESPDALLALLKEKLGSLGMR